VLGGGGGGGDLGVGEQGSHPDVPGLKGGGDGGLYPLKLLIFLFR